MPRLDWSAVGQRFYEMGVDRGVLYVGSLPGVAWTGLISVNESPSGGEPRPYYIDGTKYINVASAEEFEATIEAFNSPPEFSPCDGSLSIANGLFATQQPRKPFGFSYRTRIGNDLDGPNHAYKIHIVYNALAAPSNRENRSLGGSVEPSTLNWSISTLPPSLVGYKPTAHFVVDSRKTPKNLLTTLEDILYGSATQAPRLPNAQELVDLFSSPGPVLRRNLVSNPAAVSGTLVASQLGWGLVNWWGVEPTLGAGNLTTQTGPGPVPEVTAFVRRTWTTASAGGDQGFAHGLVGSQGYPVVPGQTYTFSSYLRASSAGKTANMVVKGLDATHAEIQRIEGLWQPLPTNQWFRVSFTLTIPVGISSINLWSNLSSDTWAVGDYVDGTALLVEEGSVLGSYFDGSTFDYGLTFFSWEGVPHNSKSVVRSWDY